MGRGEGRGYKKSLRNPHKSYSKEEIEQAVQDVKNGMTFRDASEKYGITASVIHRHLKNPNTMKKGRPTVLNEQIEDMLVTKINICAEWGYPLDEFDLRMIIKNYLCRLGKNVPEFKNNLPGRDFARGFLLRHKDKISTRLCQNIKRSRAAVSPDIINLYFDRLEETLREVPPCNIINYDETNLSDDPKRKKVIVKRGCKYPERVMNTSKAATSVMFSITGDGKMLPPYTVYKALHLYDTWTEKGPKGAYYGRTPSGWFDADCFGDWVEKIALPYFRKCEGKKILIGDNLSSHLSIDLVNKCAEYGISFVFIPSNSTHLTQPLDVSFYRPLKENWRQILLVYKKGEGRRETTIPKSKFPELLKQLVIKVQENAASNIASGFRKTGIIPLDRNEVLKKLPAEVGEQDEVLNNSFVDLLKEMRYEKPAIRRKKKLNVELGKSVEGRSESPQDATNLMDIEENETFINEETFSDDSLPSINCTQQKTDQFETDNLSSSDDDDTMTLAQLLNEDNVIHVKRKGKVFKNVIPVTSICDIKESDWVLVAFATERGLEKLYIGKVLQLKGQMLVGSFLRNKYTKNEYGHRYIWPVTEDKCDFEFNNVVGKLQDPKESRLGLRFEVNFNDF